MLALIAKITLVVSILGIAVILIRRMPELAALPVETKKAKEPGESFFVKLKNRVISLKLFKSSSFEIFLQKILSKIRVLTLRIENITAHWLLKLRERAKKKKEVENDRYWQELKDSTSRKDKKTPR
jgi:hypothetical protein